MNNNAYNNTHNIGILHLSAYIWHILDKHKLKYVVHILDCFSIALLDFLLNYYYIFLPYLINNNDISSIIITQIINLTLYYFYKKEKLEIYKTKTEILAYICNKNQSYILNHISNKNDRTWQHLNCNTQLQSKMDKFNNSLEELININTNIFINLSYIFIVLLFAIFTDIIIFFSIIICTVLTYNYYLQKMGTNEYIKNIYINKTLEYIKTEDYFYKTFFTQIVNHQSKDSIKLITGKKNEYFQLKAKKIYYEDNNETNTDIYNYIIQSISITIILISTYTKLDITMLCSIYFSYKNMYKFYNTVSIDLLKYFTTINNSLNEFTNIYDIFIGIDKMKFTTNNSEYDIPENFNLCIYDIYMEYDRGTDKFILKNDSDVNLSIKHNDIVLINGISGSGKSTFIYSLCGLIKPTKFKIKINNNEININNLHNLIYYIPQNYIEFTPGTIKQIITGNYTSEIVIDRLSEKYINDAIEASNLPKHLYINNRELFPYQLSGGEKQKVKMAKCIYQLLLKQYPIIILDEVDESLCEDDIKFIFTNLFNLLKNRLIFITSHSPILKSFDCYTYKINIVDGNITTHRIKND